MDQLNSTEMMLAELIEQNSKQQKDVTSMKTSLDTLSGDQTKQHPESNSKTRKV